MLSALTGVTCFTAELNGDNDSLWNGGDGRRMARVVGLVTGAQRLSPTFFLLHFMGFAHDVLTPTISNSGGWGLWHLFPTHTHTLLFGIKCKRLER